LSGDPYAEKINTRVFVGFSFFPSKVFFIPAVRFGQVTPGNRLNVGYKTPHSKLTLMANLVPLERLIKVLPTNPAVFTKVFSEKT
jgi:hypothetical protein